MDGSRGKRTKRFSEAVRSAWPKMSTDFDAARAVGHILAKRRYNEFVVLRWDRMVGDAGAWINVQGYDFADADLAGWWPLPDG